MGPLDYLNRTRIAKACSLLRMTDDSILTISEKVGFLAPCPASTAIFMR
ncbi:MAG: hypothetical protein ACLUW8_01695 [Subdoligranulum sp.]